MVRQRRLILFAIFKTIDVRFTTIQSDIPFRRRPLRGVSEKGVGKGGQDQKRPFLLIRVNRFLTPFILPCGQNGHGLSLCKRSVPGRERLPERSGQPLRGLAFTPWWSGTRRRWRRQQPSVAKKRVSPAYHPPYNGDASSPGRVDITRSEPG